MVVVVLRERWEWEGQKVGPSQARELRGLGRGVRLGRAPIPVPRPRKEQGPLPLLLVRRRGRHYPAGVGKRPPLHTLCKALRWPRPDVVPVCVCVISMLYILLPTNMNPYGILGGCLVVMVSLMMMIDDGDGDGDGDDDCIDVEVLLIGVQVLAR